MSRTRLPRWLHVEPALIDRIDLGLKYSPLENTDFTDGVFLRGPVIIAATPLTSDDHRRSLPIPAVNVAIEDGASNALLRFWSSSDRQRVIPIMKKGYSDGKSILLTAIGPGQIKIRKMLDGDLSLFSSGPGLDETSTKKFVKKFWSES